MGLQVEIRKSLTKWCDLAQAWKGVHHENAWRKHSRSAGQVQELYSEHRCEFQELPGSQKPRAGGREQLGEQPSWGQTLMEGQCVPTTLCFSGHYTSTWAFTQSKVPLEVLTGGALIWGFNISLQWGQEKNLHKSGSKETSLEATAKLQLGDGAGLGQGGSCGGGKRNHI